MMDASIRVTCQIFDLPRRSGIAPNATPVHLILERQTNASSPYKERGTGRRAGEITWPLYDFSRAVLMDGGA